MADNLAGKADRITSGDGKIIEEIPKALIEHRITRLAGKVANIDQQITSWNTEKTDLISLIAKLQKFVDDIDKPLN